jgi:F0F1-type ATP synthase epsilon subunit
MNIKQEGKELFFAVSSGVLEINAKSDVIVLVDSAIEVNTYDEAKDAVHKLKSNN